MQAASSVASSLVCSAGNSDFNSAVPSINLGTLKRFFHLHKLPHFTRKCPVNLLQYYVRERFDFSFVLCGWVETIYSPGCLNHANALLPPSSVTSLSPPFLPLISLLFCSYTPCGHLENVNCDRSTGSNLIRNFRSWLPSAAMGYCGGECEIAFNL